MRPALSDAAVRSGLGVQLTRLDCNERAVPPGPTVSAELGRWWTGLHRYPSTDDRQALISALSFRHDLDTQRFVVGAGSASLLQLLARVLPAGSEVVAPDPTWEAHPDLLTTHGAVWRPVPMTGPVVDLDTVAAAMTSRTSAVVLTSPHNPTGFALGQREWLRFLEYVPEDVLVVLDEAYTEYLPEGDWADGIRTLRELNPSNLVVTRTFSKAYGLAGLRVGWAATSRVRARELNEHQIPFGVGTLGLRAAVAALADESVHQAQVSAMRREREWLHEQFLALGLPSVCGHGNFLWLPLGDDSAHLVGALKRRGIAVKLVPGAGIRVTIGARDEHDALLRALGDALR
ncbi:pyridoxal phosphate-dependent aminotransferase [Saccharopolyspora griseoalba]|uniref:Pyridoxal phosphate-dependent aminotransferase n=1 Tax=Saccharopolyspora griseoalba TaxID=1431848 RepID=A0ABW2LSB2_9PSEU